MKNSNYFTNQGRTRHVALATLLGLLGLTCMPVAAQAAPTTVASLRDEDPYRYVGRILGVSDSNPYIATATVVKPSSLLTAAHVLYSECSGWHTSVRFERSYNYGTSVSNCNASGLFVLGSYAANANRGKAEEIAGFSRDLGGVVCFTRPAEGLHAAWKQDTKLLTGRSYNMALGYGAEVNSGEELLRSIPRVSFSKVSGSFFMNSSCGIEGGMSGGPVFAKIYSRWYVCAVNVSGPEKIYDKYLGVRAIDRDAANLIRTKLK